MKIITLLLIPFLFMTTAWAEEEEVAPPQPVYVELKPSFITNLRTRPKRRLAHIKASIQLKVIGDDKATELGTVMPAVKHALITYLGARTKKQASDIKNRPKLRQGALKAVQTEVEAALGKPLVEDIFFTNFTVQ